jgi:hypothetical protein
MLRLCFCPALITEHAYGHEQPVQAAHCLGGPVKKALMPLVVSRFERAPRDLCAASHLKVLADSLRFRLIPGRKVDPGAPTGQLSCGVSGNGGRGPNDEHICSADLRHRCEKQ